MSLASEIVRIATSQVGVREVGGNNLGPEIAKYQRATKEAPGSWPWCAAFTAWVLREALATTEGQIYLTKNGLSLDAWRCKTALAFGWLNWGRDKKLTVFDETTRGMRAKAGDFVVFDFSHIGIVVQDQLPGEDVIYTVEGNTNVAGARDSTSGDGVCKKTRKVGVVRGYVRL